MKDKISGTLSILALTSSASSPVLMNCAAKSFPSWLLIHIYIYIYLSLSLSNTYIYIYIYIYIYDEGVACHAPDRGSRHGADGAGGGLHIWFLRFGRALFIFTRVLPHKPSTLVRTRNKPIYTILAFRALLFIFNRVTYLCI